MSADIVTQPLSKVDSAIDDAPASPTESKIKHRRTSSTVSGVFNINDLGKLSFRRQRIARMSRNSMLTLRAEKENVDLAIAPETQKLNW